MMPKIPHGVAHAECTRLRFELVFQVAYGSIFAAFGHLPSPAVGSNLLKRPDFKGFSGLLTEVSVGIHNYDA